MNRFTKQSSAQNFSFFIFGLCFDVFVHAILYSLTLLSVDSVDRQTPKNYHTPNQSQEKRNDCRRTKRIHTDNSMMVGWLDRVETILIEFFPQIHSFIYSFT